MTDRAKSQINSGMTWFWRASVVAMLGTIISTVGYFGTKVVDKATMMSADINQIKISLGEQAVTNGNQVYLNAQFDKRITKLEK